MESSGTSSLSRSFERHLRAKNLSSGTVASYLVGVRRFTAFLQPHGRELTEASRADLDWCRCYGAAAARPAYPTSTRTSSVTPSLTSGSPKAGERPT